MAPKAKKTDPDQSNTTLSFMRAENDSVTTEMLNKPYNPAAKSPLQHFHFLNTKDVDHQILESDNSTYLAPRNGSCGSY